MQKVRVKNDIGYVSLVGINKEKYPVDYGNYFSLGGFHVLNMWYENFKHLELDKEFIDAVQFGDRHIVIIDEDVPDDYLNNEPCFTGGGGMTKGDRIDVLNYMFPGFSRLKCMCCDSAKHVSVSFNMGGGNSGGINLSKGTCMICDRQVFTNHKIEVSEEIWKQLYKISKSIPYDGAYLAPYRIVTSIDPGFIYDETKSRYYKKEVDPNSYGEVSSKNEIKPDIELESKIETRYTKKHRVGMIKVSDLK
jgi:hypothetical protein